MADQLKKLFYNKKFIDSADGSSIAEWKIAPWKVFGLILSLSVAMILLYAFAFTKDTVSFLSNVLFYTIVLLITIAGIWLLGNKLLSLKQRLTYFLIAFALIWLLYWVLSIVFGYVHLINFYIGGYALWVIITLLAFLGAKRIDGQIDRNDILFSLLVLAVFIGANVPMTTNGTTSDFTISHITEFNELEAIPITVTYGDIPSAHYAQVKWTNNSVTENVNIGYDTVSNHTSTRTFTFTSSHSAGFLENIDGIITKILTLVKF